MDARAEEYIPNKIKDEDCFETINIRQPTIIKNAADYFLNNYKEYLDKQVIKLTEQQLIEADEDAKLVYQRIYDYIKKPPANEYLTKIDDNYPDVNLWNLRLEEYIKKHDVQPNYLDTSILYTECFMYRSLASAFFKSKYFKNFDAFQNIKRDGLLRAKIASTKLIEYTSNIANRLKENKSTIKNEFSNYLRFALWGNRFDLSCDYGFQNTDNIELIEDLKKQESKIVSDSTDDIFEYFNSNKLDFITIVLDNSGSELLGDLCFIEMLYQTGLIHEKCVVRFEDKSFPWFVSDVLHEDFLWLLNCLQDDFESEIVKKMAKRWINFLSNGNWKLRTSLFWTSPYDFNEMKRISPDLYEGLSKSQFIMFKGDLNYRKLISDFLWDTSTSFEIALRGFKPSSIAALRTVKCRPIVGVSKSIELPSNYWINGDHAVIHFYKKN